MFVVNGVCNNKCGSHSTKIMINIIAGAIELYFRSCDKIECNAKD